MEESIPQNREITREPDGRFPKGISGNPGGRPKGSLKDYMKRRLAEMSESEKEDFLEKISPEVKWKMAEGNPESKSEVVVETKVDTSDPALLEALKVLKEKEKENL